LVPLKKVTKKKIKRNIDEITVASNIEADASNPIGYVEEQDNRPIRLRRFGKFRERSKQLTSITVSASISTVTEQLEINVNIQRIVEAILFVAKRPMTAKQVLQTFPELEQPALQEIEFAIAAIIEDYKTRPIELKQVASGYRFQIKQDLSYWVSRLFEEKPPKYSRALLETLSIIAYRQPVTRADIEDIRGVSVSSGIIQTLLEREWVRVVAHKEAPGRPGLYGTTKQFLDYFNITSLNQLPTLEEIKNLEGSIDNTKQSHVGNE
jgi:segregation and condensation protein B